MKIGFEGFSSWLRAPRAKHRSSRARRIAARPARRARALADALATLDRASPRQALGSGGGRRPGIAADVRSEGVAAESCERIGWRPASTAPTYSSSTRRTRAAISCSTSSGSCPALRRRRSLTSYGPHGGCRVEVLDSRLESGETIVGHVRDFDRQAARVFRTRRREIGHGVPVFAEGRWLGLIGFDDCRGERDWSAAEIDTIKIMAELIGAGSCAYVAPAKPGGRQPHH